MNVIVSNKYQPMLQNLGIDIIREMNGEFEVDEIISKFQNFFYQRMILDITSIKNYKDIKNLQRLSMSLDMDKVILLLDGSQETSDPSFISQLISMGIYNFAKNIEDIQYLYNTPNSYRDVAQYHNLSSETIQVQPNSKNNNQSQTIIKTVYVDRPQEIKMCRIIGIKNVTKHAGATTLVYMLLNKLKKKYNIVAIEIDSSDFKYFRDEKMISIGSDKIITEINKYKENDIVFIDINKSTIAESLCTEVIYLMEPTILKLNKLVALNPGVLATLKNKKVILNKSLLSQKDVSDLSLEANIDFIYNMPPVNDRDTNNQNIDELISILGFIR